MSQRLLYYSLFVFAFILLSCEKIIDLNLKDVERKIVIEASISNHSKECFVYISQTQHINEAGKFNGVSFAKIAIKDQYGKTDSIVEIEKGVYYNNFFKGKPGETYYLTIELNGNIYSASSTMPATIVPLDSISVTYNDIYQNYTTSAYFLDPANEENYYLFMIYKNNKKYNSFFTSTDEYINGKNVKENLPVFSTDEEDNIHLGDTVKVRMMQIDKNVYKYFYSLNAGALGGTGGPGSFGSPANPVSNISGDALGYFSAYINHSATVVVK